MFSALFVDETASEHALGCPSLSNVGRIQQGLGFLLRWPDRKIISTVLPGNKEGVETAWQEEASKESCKWNNNVVLRHFMVKSLFQQANHRPRPQSPPCVLTSSTDSAHCFPRLFPQDVGQGLLPKRWGQPCSSLFPRSRTGWVWNSENKTDLQSWVSLRSRRRAHCSPLVRGGMHRPRGSLGVMIAGVVTFTLCCRHTRTQNPLKTF